MADACETLTGAKHAMESPGSYMLAESNTPAAVKRRRTVSLRSLMENLLDRDSPDHAMAQADSHWIPKQASFQVGVQPKDEVRCVATTGEVELPPQPTPPAVVQTSPMARTQSPSVVTAPAAVAAVKTETKTATQASDAVQLFSKIRVLFITGWTPAGGLSAKRACILKDLVLKHGGKVRSQPSSKLRVTHIVCPSAVAHNTYVKTLDARVVRVLRTAEVVVPEWISACVTEHALVPEDGFLVFTDTVQTTPSPPPLPTAACPPSQLTQHAGAAASRALQFSSVLEDSQEEEDPAQDTTPVGASAEEKKPAEPDVMGYSGSFSSQEAGHHTSAPRVASDLQSHYIPVESLHMKRTYLDRHKNYLACQQTSTRQSNLNEHVTSVLEQLSGMYKSQGDEWRCLGYRKAVGIVRNLRFRVSTVEQAQSLQSRKGLGKKMVTKIAEIVHTGTLAKLQAMETDEYSSAIKTLTSVWGIGTAAAQKLYTQGFRNVSDLRARGMHLLSHAQQVGLKHFEALSQRIPRGEVAKIDALVKAEAEVLLPGVLSLVCGSYRRGKATSGDVDMIFTHDSNEKLGESFLSLLCQRLRHKGFLIDTLSESSETFSSGRKGYMGVCRLSEESLARRIDFKVYPREMFAFAVLYFTGSDHFNRSMRFYAGRKSLTLSDQGLHNAARVRGKKVAKGKSVFCATEKDIFRALGLDYVPPELRNTYENWQNAPAAGSAAATAIGAGAVAAPGMAASSASSSTTSARPNN